MDYVQAHVRGPETLRRANIVRRFPDRLLASAERFQELRRRVRQAERGLSGERHDLVFPVAGSASERGRRHMAYENVLPHDQATHHDAPVRR